ncbi:MAG: putative pre-16S rRNA nuclease [Acidimicrobiales bacterium]|nr:putative pre-16S rRNA nuclease [Acidimicrobiales bacterium]
MRALGLDLGTRRIGVALSDAEGRVATPVEVIERTRRRGAVHQRIGELVDEFEVERVVVGLPLNMDGTTGSAARSALDEAAALRDTLPVPVETYDERLTTVSADRCLNELQMKAEERRRVVDKVAAAVMLQAWLDHCRSAEEEEA